MSPAKNSQANIELSNSFEGVSQDDDSDIMDGVEENTETEEKVAEVKEKKVKIPPLVIYNHIKDHVKTVKDMQKDLKEKLSLVCKQDRVIIYTKNQHDYSVMREKIEAAQVSFHTYSLSTEKPVISILKGLPPNITAPEIKEELENEHKLKVLEVKQFIKKQDKNGKVSEIKLPIYCVKFENNTQIADVKKVRVLCWCRISWERNFSSSSVTQCYKCQAFGHIAKNCFRQVVCANCAEAHNTSDCTTKDLKKCINCGGEHKANDVECEAYIRSVNRKKKYR